MKLTEKQKRFADYYIESGNASDAARKAGYSPKTAFRTGQENMQKPAIKQYIDEKLGEIASKRIMGATEALELLTSIGRGEMTEELYIPTEMGVERVVKKPDIKDRQKAIDSILKRYPTHKHDELKEQLMQAQINKIK
ncbi:MAG TPA: terminase small subunit, partial [Massilibacterium sp.]|nr:terminase small subunit [Massilibacterium sp.]